MFINSVLIEGGIKALPFVLTGYLAVFLLQILLIKLYSEAINSVLDFSSQKPNIKRVFEILELEHKGKKHTAELGDGITCSKVSFKYYENQEFKENLLLANGHTGEEEIRISENVVSNCRGAKTVI